MPNPLTWKRFVESAPEASAGLEAAVEDYDWRYSSFWQDGPARLLRAQIEAGEITLREAAIRARSLVADAHAARGQYPNPTLGEHGAKLRIGLQGLAREWLLAGITYATYDAAPIYTITTGSGSMPTIVDFGRTGQVRSVRFRRLGSPDAIHGPTAEAALIDRLTSEN